MSLYVILIIMKIINIPNDNGSRIDFINDVIKQDNNFNKKLCNVCQDIIKNIPELDNIQNNKGIKRTRSDDILNEQQQPVKKAK